MKSSRSGVLRRSLAVLGATILTTITVSGGVSPASAATLPPPGEIRVEAVCQSLTVFSNIESADVTAKVTTDGTVHNYPEVPGTLFPLGPGSLILSNEIPAIQTASAYSGSVTFTPTNGDAPVSQSFSVNCNPDPPADKVIDPPAKPSVVDDPNVSGDAHYSVPADSSEFNWTLNQNGSVTVTTLTPNTKFSNGSPSFTYPAPTDVFNDKDGDGVGDGADGCPTVAGPASNNGCPKQDPPGNNGTVKIDGVAFDDHPNNEPHVGCQFQVDFYGFDKGVGNAKVSFELQSPTADGRTLTVTSGDLTPNIGEDAAGGGTDLDASVTYTLKFTGAPHPKQGYHVKLTVNAPGSQGNDVKHKVFWVEGCGDTTPQPEGKLLASSDKCEQISFSANGVKPEGATATFKLDGVLKPAGTYTVAPGSHTVELYVDGKLVDSKTVTVKECPKHEDKEFTVTYGMQECVPGIDNDMIGSPVVSPEGAATVSEGSWSGGKRTVTVTPNEGYKPAKGTELSKDYTDDGGNCGVTPPSEAENNYHTGALSCDNSVSPEPTGSIVNSMINVDDETDKSISLTVLTKNEQGAVVNTDTRTVPDGESYYNEVTGLEAGNYTVEFMSGQTVLKTLTVNVAICEPEPELTDVTVTAGCGYVVVTNPNSVPVTFAYGSFSNPKEDGKTLVFPGEPVKVPTTRTSLDWVAYDAATGEPAGMGAGTIKVKQDCDTPPGPKPPKPPQVPDNPKHPKPPFKPHTPPTKVDVCKNVGMQSSVPAGYYRASNGYCYKIPSSTVPHTGGGSSAAIMQAANAETPISPWWATIGIGMAIAGGAALRSKRVQEWARI